MKQKLDKLLDRAYCEYSGVHVAAIVVDRNGNEYKGVNVENAAYPSGMCAERNAIFNAVTNGVKPGDIKEVHVTSSLKNKNLYPCAGCLQVMLEFLNKDSLINMYHNDEVKTHKLNELVPYGVTADSFE